MTDITAVPLRPVGKSGIAALWIGLGLLFVGGIAGAYATTARPVLATMTPAQFLAANARKAGVKTTPSGLEYKVLAPGAGPKPTTADLVKIDYDGRLVTGAAFDSSAKNGGPVQFPVAGVVPGFSEAVQLMPRGAKYRVWIKPELGYGPDEKRDPQTGKIVIPANSVLVFDITLRDFEPLPAGAGRGIPGL